MQTQQQPAVKVLSKASESDPKMNFYKIKLYEKILNTQLKWKIKYQFV